MGRYYDLIASTWAKPITQVEGIACTNSTDGFATLANQTPQSGYVYPSATPGHLWFFNADVGTDGLPDAAAYYRAQGKIEDSIGAWRAMSADLLDDRDLQAVRPFATTLDSAYVSGSSISTVAAPSVGMALQVPLTAGGFGTSRQVTAVTGSGPYTVTLSGTVGGEAASANTVREAPGDGVHPSGVVHRDVLAAEIVAWKSRRGFV